MMNNIKIAIAEDHSLVRKGFIKMLSDFPEIQIIVEAKDGQELLLQIKNNRPDVILLDIEMPVQNGQEVLQKLKELDLGIKVIVVSAFTNDSEIIANVRLGASSFLTKHTDINTLIRAIHNVLEEGFYFDVETLELLDKNGMSPLGAFKKLNQKELRILKLLCEAKSAEEIAFEIGITSSTVRWYKHQIWQKTNTNNMEGLLDYAVKHRYIEKL